MAFYAFVADAFGRVIVIGLYQCVGPNWIVTGKKEIRGKARDGA